MLRNLILFIIDLQRSFDGVVDSVETKLLPEEEDRRKLMLMARCFPKIQDKWSSCALAYICAMSGVEFNRYSKEAFGFLPDGQIVWENRLLGDLNCLFLDNILEETSTSECLRVVDSPYILRTLEETEKTFAEDHSKMSRIKQILKENCIATRRFELYLLAQFMRGLKEEDVRQIASNLGKSVDNLQNYRTAALELLQLQSSRC